MLRPQSTTFDFFVLVPVNAETSSKDDDDVVSKASFTLVDGRNFHLRDAICV